MPISETNTVDNIIGLLSGIIFVALGFYRLKNAEKDQERIILSPPKWTENLNFISRANFKFAQTRSNIGLIKLIYFVFIVFGILLAFVTAKDIIMN